MKERQDDMDLSIHIMTTEERKYTYTQSQQIISQTGCIGLCQYEPIVEVFEPGKEKVTYIKMDAEKAAEVVERHLIGGHVVEKYSMAESGLK